MKIEVQKEVFRSFHPKFVAAFILVDGMDNKSKIRESQHLLQDMEELVRQTFHKNITKNNRLVAPWKVAQAEFGKSAKHYHTSVERLLKAALQGKSVKAGDVLTNIVRYLSLRYIVPIGVDDTSKVKGKVTFAIASGKEKIGLFRSLKKGALYYHDEKKVLGTKLDYWKNPVTKLDQKSASALIHIEIIPPITNKKLKEIAMEASSLIHSFCGGKIKTVMLSKSSYSKRI